jgi:predicted transposase YbfD/YdcC
LLDLIDIEGSIVTLDAMGCQREIAAKIIEKKADYILNKDRITNKFDWENRTYLSTKS